MSDRERHLPPGWACVHIGEVVVPKVRQGVPAAEDDFKYIDIGSIDNQTKQIDSPKTMRGSEAPSRARQYVRSNDVLVSLTRPNLNAVAKVPEALDGAICSTGFDVLRATGVEPAWLFFTVRLKSFVDSMTELVQGALYPAVRRGDVRAFELPVPPLKEQQRIVAKIDALQGRTRRAREALAEVGTLLEEFRRSVLAAAFRGDLTADWRAAHPGVEPASELLARTRAERRCRWEEAQLAKYEAAGRKPPKNWRDRYTRLEPIDDSDLPQVPRDWCWTAIEELAAFESNAICAGPFGTIFKARDFRAEGVPIIFLRHVAPGKYLTSRPGFMDREKWEAVFQPYSVYGGELLVAKLGEPPGTAAIFPENGGVAMITPDVMKMIVNQDVASTRFLMHYLNSRVAQRFSSGAAYGATRQRMNLTIFRRMPIPLAPTDEQRQLASRVDRALAAIDSVGEFVATNRRELETLDHSILETAFRGELVPQDPNDEPASVLFERIRLEKAKEREAGKVSKPSRSSKMARSSPLPTRMRRPLRDVLAERAEPMPPEELLKAAGYDAESIEDFYLALREAVRAGAVREHHPDRGPVLLEHTRP